MNFLKRRIIAILISMTIVFASSSIIVLEVIQERAEERRIIAEEEAEIQRVEEERLAEEQRLLDEAQVVLDLITARVAEGYDDWPELMQWSIDNDIEFEWHVNNEPLPDEVFSLVDLYGLVGQYIEATAYLNSALGEKEPTLILHFESITHNKAIQELSALNKNSEEALNDWLESTGLEMLEEYFAIAEINDFDLNGDPLATELEFGKSFSHWDFQFDLFASAENATVYIERKYEVAESRIEQIRMETNIARASKEEIQQVIIDVLNEADKEVFREAISFFAEQEFIAELLDVAPTDIFGVLYQGGRRGNHTTSISIQRLDRNGNNITRREGSEETFSHWDFVYEVSDEDGIMRLIMRHHFDIETD